MTAYTRTTLEEMTIHIKLLPGHDPVEFSRTESQEQANYVWWSSPEKEGFWRISIYVRNGRVTAGLFAPDSGYLEGGLTTGPELDERLRALALRAQGLTSSSPFPSAPHPHRLDTTAAILSDIQFGLREVTDIAGFATTRADTAVITGAKR